MASGLVPVFGLGLGLEGGSVSALREAWPTLIKPGRGAAAAVSFTAVERLRGHREAGPGRSVLFKPQFSPSPVTRRNLRRGDGPLHPQSEKCKLSWTLGLMPPCQLSPPAPDSAGRKMAHCSSCGDSGHYRRVPPPDLAAPGGGAAPDPCTCRTPHPAGGAGTRGSRVHRTPSRPSGAARARLG